MMGLEGVRPCQQSSQTLNWSRTSFNDDAFWAYAATPAIITNSDFIKNILQFAWDLQIKNCQDAPKWDGTPVCIVQAYPRAFKNNGTHPWPTNWPVLCLYYACTMPVLCLENQMHIYIIACTSLFTYIYLYIHYSMHRLNMHIYIIACTGLYIYIIPCIGWTRIHTL